MCSSDVGGPVSGRKKRSVGDADARQIENGAEVHRKSGTAWMVTTRRVDDQDVGVMRQAGHSGGEQGSGPQCQKTRQVGRAGRAMHGRLRDHDPSAHDHCRCPRWISCGARAGVSQLETHPCRCHIQRHVKSWPPARRECETKGVLNIDQRIRRCRPGRHLHIILTIISAPSV